MLEDRMTREIPVDSWDYFNVKYLVRTRSNVENAEEGMCQNRVHVNINEYTNR